MNTYTGISYSTKIVETFSELIKFADKENSGMFFLNGTSLFPNAESSCVNIFLKENSFDCIEKIFSEKQGVISCFKKSVSSIEVFFADITETDRGKRNWLLLHFFSSSKVNEVKSDNSDFSSEKTDNGLIPSVEWRLFLLFLILVF